TRRGIQNEKGRWSAWSRMRRPKLRECLNKGLQFLRYVRSLRGLCFEFRELLGDVVELLADRGQLEPQLIQLPREIELFPKVGARRFNARIHCDSQRLAESFPVNR